MTGPATSPAEAAEAAAPAKRGNVAPGLHLVATPIGAARDITLHALDVLALADVLAAEDTRTLRHLMELHGIPVAGRPLLAVHDHNESGAAPKILAALEARKIVAYASEAGTPLISDPGFTLVRRAVEAGQPVHAAPGASAVLAALTVAGLPTDRFLFAGFPPSAQGDRQRFLAGLTGANATVVLYESPRRVVKTLQELQHVFGATHPAALCRELTKRHQEVLRGGLDHILNQLEGRDIKGEVVLVIDRATAAVAGEDDINSALDQALSRMSVKDAASFVAQTLNVSRKAAYQLALARKPRPPADTE